MANATLSGACPAPFLDSSRFPQSGGYVAGRLCAPLDEGEGLTCCLPCPTTDYIYPPSFKTWYRVGESLNAMSLALLVFLLVTFAALPVEKTRRHYLSVCLVIAITLEALGFIVPLGVQPPQCFNEITPNDMYSSLTCAWAGALLISGGVAIAVWIFLRALSMHLQICWDIIPGRKYFYGAQAGGWGVVALLFTLTVVFTGFSFRFGDACHVNSKNSIKFFWGPLLGIAGLAAIAQAATFIYCINVYLKNIWSDEKTETQTSSGHTSSINTHSAKAVYRRVRKVLWLQWRSMLIVVFILADVVFFSVVFLYMDNVVVEFSEKHDIKRATPFLLCLIQAGGPSEECYELGQELLVNMETVSAILILLGLAGTQAFFLLARWSMFTGWAEWFKTKFSKQREFVSLDAKRFSGDQRTYELLHVNSKDQLPSPRAVYTPGTNTLVSPASPTETYSTFGGKSGDYFSKEYAEVSRPPSDIRPSSRRSQTGSQEYSNWQSPAMSFSGPRTPSQSRWQNGPGSRNVREFGSWNAHARGGLSMHPPTEEDEPDFAIYPNRI